jgi:hypothetical protein
MEAFWAILLSAIIISKWLKSESKEIDKKELRRNTVKSRWDRKRIKAEKIKQEEKIARKIEKDKRKQKDTEIITVILPTIRNDGK